MLGIAVLNTIRWLKKEVEISYADEIVLWSFFLQVIVYSKGLLPVGSLPVNKIKLVFGLLLGFGFSGIFMEKTTSTSYDKCPQVKVVSTSKWYFQT